MKKNTYLAVGGMAGSSMDGLDLVLVAFSKDKQGSRWSFEVLRSETIAYPDELNERLGQSGHVSNAEQKTLDNLFGRWISSTVLSFIPENICVDYLAIHGHTVIHKPKEGVSWQLGSGEVIARATGTPTITEFRNADISLGGQGAPLVPFGDYELFSSYDACLNLGGIANVSIKSTQQAWDICPANQVLNAQSLRMGIPFDKGGALAKRGTLQPRLMDRLEQDSFIYRAPPKSLSNNHFPAALFKSFDPEDALATYGHFVGKRVAEDLKTYAPKPGKMLITGGGALNDYLVQCIRTSATDWQLVLPDEELIFFKEAIIFAYLGLCRVRNKTNVLASVTGALRNSSSGTIHLPHD